MSYTIAGIQQIGIGIPNVHEAFKWYRENFGMDIPVFEEAAEANLMLPYTGGKPHQRHAILAINMSGGGGFEIWQYTSRTPHPPASPPILGDLGLYCTRMKSRNVAGSYEFMKARGISLISQVMKDPAGKPVFFLKDPWNNIFEVVEGNDWFGTGKQLTGGPEGCMIGVSDMDRSLKFYKEILGYDTIVYDNTAVQGNFKALSGGEVSVRRVLLSHSQSRSGAFSKLLGSSSIELIQTSRPSAAKIFANRYWGDLGFIHLCFDINGMEDLRATCHAKGYPFTVDSSNSFDMGEAAGHFSYIEDPDGTLVEFVETHKIPILKKIGWYLDLRKRNTSKALPSWMLKAMSLNRVK